jgi:hypothetical protein
MWKRWQGVLHRNTKSRGMVQKGLYAVELLRWIQSFSREQFLVFSLEETSQHTQRVMQRIHAHIGIPYIPLNDTSPENTATFHSDTNMELISDNMYVILEKVYKPFDEMLSVVLEDDEWNIPWTFHPPV